MTHVPKWFVPEEARPEVNPVLVLHGLNMRPELMDDWGVALRDRGVPAYRTVFAGHEKRGNLATATADQWVQDVERGMREILGRYPDSKPAVLCYSLGCLAFLNYLQRTPSSEVVSRVAFIAPPVVLNRYGTLLRFLTPFRVFGLSLPSRSLTEVRLNDGTPLATYFQLLKLRDQMKQNTSLCTDRDAVFIAEQDEFIDVPRTKVWFEEHGLRSSEFSSFQNEMFPTPPIYYHLLGVPSTLPDKARRKILEQVVRHLIGPRS